MRHLAFWRHSIMASNQSSRQRVGPIDRQSVDVLSREIYSELHRIAHREMHRSRPKTTLQTTGLVHEAYERIASRKSAEIGDREHFLALAATAMRHILIDYARTKSSQKRGGDWHRVTLGELAAQHALECEEVLGLHEALTRLERFDPRLGQVVECRFFGGMTVKETASALGLSTRTVDRAWQKARSWLYREINET